MGLLLSLERLTSQSAIKEILTAGEEGRYGLTLTPTDAMELVQTRNVALRANGRIEVGSGTIGKIVDAFSDSSFILQEDYPGILHELLEVFYYMKNETLDGISDDELIRRMKSYFENQCHGSLELLAGRELEELARNLRCGKAPGSGLGQFRDEMDTGEV